MADITEIIQGLEARPKCYITLYATQGNFKPDMSTADLAQIKFQEIGAVQRLNINSSRATGAWRELDVNTAGKPVETFPGLPGYELELERVVLYDSMLPEALQFADGHDLIKQNKPITLKLEMWSPDGQNTKVWYIWGIWFKNNPIEFDVTEVDDLRIIQRVQAAATGICGDNN